ncbi:hypothetical protein ACFLUT_02050 [Chloroflexota bacterium]
MTSNDNSSSPKKGQAAVDARLWTTPWDGPSAMLRRAWSLLRKEGLRGLLGGSGRFVGALGRRMFQSETYRLYECRVDEAALMPVATPSEEIDLRLIETREDARKLVAEGYEDIPSTIPRSGRRLDSGAVAACAFVRKEFASIDWIALSGAAKLAIDELPYTVDFENREVCTGGAFVARRFRRRGIAAYRFSVQVQYMHHRGCLVCRNAIAPDNIPSQRGVERHGGRYDRIGHCRRILWWESWKETAVE